MITRLLIKCVVMIAVIHGIRRLSQQIGPRASGLVLGLPSSTAVLLVLCGWEKGAASATAMAEASLLGLVAAVALPLAYAQAVRLGWHLAGALTCAVAGYLTVAFGLGFLQPAGPVECLAIALGALGLASHLAGRIGLPQAGRTGVLGSETWTVLFRTFIPVVYVTLVGITAAIASPSWAGLVSMFPSMSTVLLAVTHLEEGPAEASQIARTLPPANLSTVVFLATFRFGCPALGLGWATLCGYIAALTNLAAIELVAQRVFPGEWVPRRIRWFASRTRSRRGLSHHRAGIRRDARSTPRSFGRMGAAPRRHFAPRLEILPC
jgi:hypothetical protein